MKPLKLSSKLLALMVLKTNLVRDRNISNGDTEKSTNSNHLHLWILLSLHVVKRRGMMPLFWRM
jgi:hypothetical protein